MISIGNRTEWSPIRSVIIRVITKYMHTREITFDKERMINVRNGNRTE